jgi:hypothetical protein
MAAMTQVQKNLQAVMREALRIQDRFVAEPLFARTGRGYLKGEGVSTGESARFSRCGGPLHRRNCGGG